MKMKYVLIIVLVILSVLVIIPPFRYHYIYPTAGDDTVTHLQYFQNMDNQKPLYYGQYMVGKLINDLPINPLTSFSWFNYVVLVLALWVIGFTVSLSTNYLAGTLAVIMLFGKSYLLELFHWGQIFDIVGIAILLPIILLCLHKIDKGIGWIIGAVCSIGLFAVFHANGKYLFALVPIVACYEAIRWLISRKHNMVAEKLKEYRIIAYSGILGIILEFLYVAKVSIDPKRLSMDASILLIICACGLLGKYIYGKSVYVIATFIVIVSILATPTLMQWEHNNSAVKNADKDAIAYVNTLSGDTYTASPLIAQDIYGLFINKKFQVGVDHADYVIDRSLPETPRSDPKSVFYENQDRNNITDNLSGYKVLKVFNDNEIDDMPHEPIIVTVYGK